MSIRTVYEQLELLKWFAKFRHDEFLDDQLCFDQSFEIDDDI